MEVIILKYVQLVCITIFMKNNAECAQFMSRSEEINNLKVAACAANCLKLDVDYVSLIFCRRNFKFSLPRKNC